jgi:hypothetical protein
VGCVPRSTLPKFRKPLTALLERVSSIKAPSFEFSAPHPPASIQAESKTPPPELLKGEIGSASETLSIAASAETMPALATKVLAEKRAAVLSLGTDNAIVVEDVETIKGQLADLNFPLDSAETSEMLIRHLASTQLMLRCERTHRVIYGSQIVALHMTNAGPQPEDALRPIFENARAKEPQFYGSYSFEDWIGFLIKEVTVKKAGESYAITVYGRTYLDYIGVFAPRPKPH